MYPEQVETVMKDVISENAIPGADAMATYATSIMLMMTFLLGDVKLLIFYLFLCLLSLCFGFICMGFSGTPIRAALGVVIDFGGKKLALLTAGFVISLCIVVAEFIRVIFLIPRGVNLTEFTKLFTPMFPFWVLLPLLATGLSVAWMLIYPGIHRRRLVAEYRRSEEHLIKP